MLETTLPHEPVDNETTTLRWLFNGSKKTASPPDFGFKASDASTPVATTFVRVNSIYSP